MRYTLEMLHAHGFDASAPFGECWNLENRFAVKCSACAAVVVNGHPIHERGCPNDMHECAGCNTLVPVRVKYCEDCQ